MKDDQRIRQEVIAELDADMAVHSTDVGVAVKDGIVTLTGFVPSYAEKRVAERAAQRVSGVRGLAEELKVRLPLNCQRTDADIADIAATTLKWHVMIPNSKVKVKVQEGWLTLEGVVDHGFEKRAAESAVRNLTGVTGVTNMIEVKPRPNPEAIKADIERKLKESAEKDAHRVRVETSDGVITLTGTVRSWAEREDASQAAWRSPGVSRVDNYISVGT